MCEVYGLAERQPGQDFELEPECSHLGEPPVCCGWDSGSEPRGSGAGEQGGGPGCRISQDHWPWKGDSVEDSGMAGWRPDPPPPWRA